MSDRSNTRPGVGTAWLKELGYGDVTVPMDDEIARWWAWYSATGAYYSDEDEDSQGNTFKVQRTSIHPAEMVCEDWASILVNERDTLVTVCSDDDADETFAAADGVLQDWLSESGFIVNAREVVEDEMWGGTAAWALRIDGIPEDGTTSSDIRILPESYDALHILPLTYDGNACDEAAFYRSATLRGRYVTQLCVHRRAEDGTREILTRYYGADGKRVDTGTGYAESVSTGTVTPTFALTRPGVKNVYWRDSPFGASVFDRALGSVLTADDAIDNMHRDIYLGQKMLGIPERYMKRDQYGNYTVPRAKDQQLFLSFEDDDSLAAANHGGFFEFNPDLRMTDNRLALKTSLELLGFRCGLGKDYYSLDETGSIAKTAKEVASSEKVLLRNAEKHARPLVAAMTQVCESVLEVMATIGGLDLPDCRGHVRVKLPDAIVEDDSTRRDADRTDVASGIMATWEYRSRWYGEDEETARRMAGEAVTTLPVL